MYNIFEVTKMYISKTALRILTAIIMIIGFVLARKADNDEAMSADLKRFINILTGIIAALIILLNLMF